MAAGSDLLDDVFFNTEVDEKVVSALVGSLESELTGTGHVNTTSGNQSAANHVGSSVVCSNSSVQGGKMGLSQQEVHRHSFGFSCVSAAAGTGVQGGVIGSTGSQGSSMDGAAGTTSAAGPSMTIAQSESNPGAATGDVTVMSDATSGVGKPGTTAVQTLNGSSVVINCHVSGGASADSGGNSSQPAVTPVNNGPVSASKGSAAVSSAPSSASTVIQTSASSAQNTVTSPVISSQPSVKSVPTVTLVRPPMQTPINAPQSGCSSSTIVSSAAGNVTSTTGSLVNKPDSTKTITQTAQVALSTAASGTTVTVRSPTVLQNLRTSAPSAVAATPPGGIRAIAPQVLAPRLTQPQQNTPNIQNIQLPPGMVLVRSESGQLLMIHQQTLAQMQAQSQSQSAMTPRPAVPTSTPPVQITSLQAPGTSLLARPVTPTTIIKQGSTVPATVTATTTLQRPPVLQVPPPQMTLKIINSVCHAKKMPLACAYLQETLENVKKCRNFLSTLIKLASSGKQSSETTANVKELVKNLLEAKIEPEDFTSRLYRELSSSPQPYLVPFLKRSLPALRQMTPDSEAFIQQSLLPQTSTQPAAAASTALTAVVLRPPISTCTTTATSTAMTKTTVISLTQTPHSKPGLMVPQQQGTVVRPQVTLAQSPMVTFRGPLHSRIIVGQPQVVKQLQAVPSLKQPLVPGAKGIQVVSQAALTTAQNKLKDAGGGTFRDDDDINDVASMAGVNLLEESARILATSSLVGTVTRSCKDETFLSTSSLTQRALEIGKKFGVSELGTDVISYISYATQQRLQNLLEKVSQVAQQKNITFKEDQRYEQLSDVRTQLKFFEQLDQMEKQRKEEQEREILLKAAKSRSRQEDPEQLRLKQKAKEMQQQELAQIRQREANLTALAAIGPRKKRKMDSPVRGASAETSKSHNKTFSSSGGGSRHFMRQRITRVNLRDLLFCLEHEKGTSHSHLLYKGFLK
uniref:TATA-box binding protein associated factor 4 n=1 Tax=Mastacembelus armatus TaxID=205130 RepID=A0A3Q3N7N9_9TELE